MAISISGAAGTGWLSRQEPISNAGRNFAHIFSRNPAYPDLLARCRREDRRLSLIEHEVQAIWVRVEWLDEWKQRGR